MVEKSLDQKLKRILDKSHVTPAARVNDTTDIHIIRGSKYPTDPSLPFRTATLDHIQCGHLDCEPGERHLGANLGLYSVTFQNDTAIDRLALEEYKQFRLEAERKGFRHFLEIFDPNRPEVIEASKIPEFINDAIVRTLGGVTAKGRRLCRHDLRCIQTPKRSQEVWRPYRTLRPQDQQRRESVGVHPFPPPHR